MKTYIFFIFLGLTINCFGQITTSGSGGAPTSEPLENNSTEQEQIQDLLKLIKKQWRHCERREKIEISDLHELELRLQIKLDRSVGKITCPIDCKSKSEKFLQCMRSKKISNKISTITTIPSQTKRKLLEVFTP